MASLFGLPRYVEKTSRDPVESNRVMKPSAPNGIGVMNAGWKTPEVVGKSGESVSPATTMSPPGRIARARPMSICVVAPPRNVDHVSPLPSPFIRSAKAWELPTNPGIVVEKAPGLVGKSLDDVEPVAAMLSVASIVRARTSSPRDPPTNVDHSRELPVGSKRVRNASQKPPTVVSSVPVVVRKVAVVVNPPTIAFPASVAATAKASVPLADPSRNVQYSRSSPCALRRITKAATLRPFFTVSQAPGVAGKSGELVIPATVARPEESTATAWARSSLLPPPISDE
jgi:hypothetical protein